MAIVARCRIRAAAALPRQALRDEFDGLVFLAGALQTMPDWADVIVVSPGVSMREGVMRLAADSGKTVLGDIELFARLVEQPVVAITGSNGKSTVTTLVGEMLRADQRKVAVGGNLGTAALDLLAEEAKFTCSNCRVISSKPRPRCVRG